MIERGDIVLANLEPVMGSEQGKIRPCLVIQNNVGNQFSSTTIVAIITSKISIKIHRMEVTASAEELQLQKPGTIKCDQIRTISVPDRIIKKLGKINPQTMQKVDQALKISLALM